ncbi:MAG: regulator [Candidatus Hydrogenedentes bacterium]|nr:regulator [Candidatus Hydrogenedentota bacterium]
MFSGICIPIILALSVSAEDLAKNTVSMSDTPFIQEFHEPYPIGDQPGMNDVRAVAADTGGDVYAATKAGVFRLKKGSKQWSALLDAANAGPAFAVVVAPEGGVWIGLWNGLFRFADEKLEKTPGIDKPVSALTVDEQGIVAAGPDGLWRISAAGVKAEPLPSARSVRALLADGKGGLWVATGMGLYHHTPEGDKLYQSEEQILSAEVYDVTYVSADGSGRSDLWAGGLGGITVYSGTERTGEFSTERGLPSVFVQCVTAAPDGATWVGTNAGVVRFSLRGAKGFAASLRHSRRWLLDDDVRDIVFDAEHTAWIATGSGVSAIRRKRMTLQEKAEYFIDICLTRHVREPGLVEKCRLRTPGDLTTWEPRDDDNDGQYTAMYLAMESFRYAVTKDPEARANAKRAFEALRFLQTVTETPGFLARTVIPTSWSQMADMNERIFEPEWADRHVRDPRYKRVETRWRPSSDGKWLWKGDTSSDEMTGHMFGYVYYYELAADDADKVRVAAHVGKIMDYIIDGGFVLKDIDGTHTRWAVWSPELLSHDPDWAAERGVNSVEILSFLKAAYHMTGNQKYQDHYLRLLNEHGYAANVRRAKTYAMSWRTHIDDELLSLAYPALFLYEDDPELKQLYRESIDHWYEGAKQDESPYFDFLYAGLTGVSVPLKPAMFFLVDTPLDLVRWTVDNSRREDLRLVRKPEIEPLQTDRLPPASERGNIRWDDNPWRAVQGDGGLTESDGVFWLLPYWMGRYYGFIQAAR